MKYTELKKKAFAAIDDQRESIFGLSEFINKNPETAYKEEKAAAAITAFLGERGFRIEYPAGGLDTAFIADFSGERRPPGSRTVDILAEYDALEGVGHGCGHNLIAASAAAAAVGVSAVFSGNESEGLFRVVGTPAEEIMTEASGKTRLIDAGVFDNTAACLMFHPWIKTGVAKRDLGFVSLRFIFSGHTAHAAADPWNGRNALDAAVLLYNSISMLRQQLPNGLKLHCILPEAGRLINVIPDRAVAEVMLRSTDIDELKTFEPRIKKCADSAAEAAGCQVDKETLSFTSPVLFDRELFELAAENAQMLGDRLEEFSNWEASSDFGDLSRVVPSVSILYKTHDQMCWHSSEVARASRGQKANEAMLRAAKILAATAVDLVMKQNCDQ